jgi:hypothetical protein
MDPILSVEVPREFHRGVVAMLVLKRRLRSAYVRLQWDTL